MTKSVPYREACWFNYKSAVAEAKKFNAKSGQIWEIKILYNETKRSVFITKAVSMNLKMGLRLLFVLKIDDESYRFFDYKTHAEIAKALRDFQ